jgi:hypothetical protein
MREHKKTPDEYIDAWLEWCSFSEMPEPTELEEIERWESACFWSPDNWTPLYVSDLKIWYFLRENEECKHPRFDVQANKHLIVFRNFLRERLKNRKIDIGFFAYGQLPEQNK